MTLPVEASDDPPQATAANGASAGKNDSSSAPASSAKLSRTISISEMASAASTRRFATPKWLSCWLEFPFRIKNNQTGEYVEEATAHAMDYSARGPINQCGSFVGSAMIRVAAVKAMKAGTPTIYGMKPSSVLTVASLIVNISAVDHTDHRKIMGTVSAFIMTMAVAVQIAINEDTWLAVWIFEIIGGYFLIMHQVCTMAYLPDLTHETPEMGHYTARFMIDQYFVQACFTLIIILVSTYWDHKDNGILASTIATARLSAGMATGIGCVLLTYAWTFLFRKRPKLREIPEEAGAGVVLSIAVTFLTFYVGMTVTEIAIASIIMLFFNLPGALISKFMCRKINPLNSFRCAEMCYAMVNALIAGTVSGPEKKGLVYPYAAMAGLAFGWMFPSQRTLTVAIIPKGQETEMMGLISFFGQIMGWLPALLFTIMNENGVDMRWSMSLISYFLATSCCLTFMCGSYEDAVQLVAHTSDEYLKQYSRNSGVDNFFDEEQIKDENDGTDGSGTNTPPSTEGKEDGVVEMA
ncbi:autophagy-related protein 22 family protein [Skeletonema marinoi]|uniref:Autophagy-related protein 22 family protein n=1 Tax=Skeletonema marinoi TaxID=267567 RepID=A0AAD9DA00_9STRA|nr:autophagy-related protein 22 family protein [Skeletonema marinoi]